MVTIDELHNLPPGYRALGWKSHDRIAVLQDGRVIAYGVNWKAVTFPSDACEVISVRVPDLRMIEYILNVQFHCTSDIACNTPIYEAVNKEITGNVVGMTIFGKEGGTTLTVEVIAIGPP